MLSPNEFTVGHLGAATSGLTLILPRGQYDQTILVTQSYGPPYAIFLREESFEGFECTGNDAWGGIIIPNVSIEMDETSIFDPQLLTAPLGTLVRRSTKLEIVTQATGRFRQAVKTPLIVGLDACPESMAAGFRRWAVYIGDGKTKRELIRVDLTNQSDGSKAR